MRALRDGEVDADLAAVEINAAQVVDALLSLFGGAHGDEAEATGALGLGERSRTSAARMRKNVLDRAEAVTRTLWS